MCKTRHWLVAFKSGTVLTAVFEASYQLRMLILYPLGWMLLNRLLSLHVIFNKFDTQPMTVWRTELKYPALEWREATHTKMFLLKEANNSTLLTDEAVFKQETILCSTSHYTLSLLIYFFVLGGNPTTVVVSLYILSIGNFQVRDMVREEGLLA